MYVTNISLLNCYIVVECQRIFASDMERLVAFNADDTFFIAVNTVSCF